jgi:flagellar biosynthetic protein FliR
MEFTTAEIARYVATFGWPWIRITAMLLAAPVFSNQQVPVRLRILLSLALTVAVLPAVESPPVVDPLSLQAVLIAAQEVLIGVLIGLLLGMAFQSVVIAGESIAMTMGLGFATMVDPQSGFTVPVLSQFLLVLATLLFLSLGGHLMLIELLAASFQTMPVAGEGLQRADLMGVVVFGSQMFAGAVLIALPAIVVLLVVQLAMGIMTRAAPQMNIFSVGFPVTILLGFLTVLFLVLPVLQPRMMQLWSAAFGAARRLIGG